MGEQSNPSIKSLLKEVSRDANRLLAAQKELTQTELQSEKKAAAQTGGMFAVAAGAGAMGGIFLLVTAAWGLVALGLPEWAGFGIVTLVLLITAGAAAAIGRSRSKGITGLPVAKAEFARTKAALLGGGNTPGTEVAIRPTTSPAPSNQTQ